MWLAAYTSSCFLTYMHFYSKNICIVLLNILYCVFALDLQRSCPEAPCLLKSCSESQVSVMFHLPAAVFVVHLQNCHIFMNWQRGDIFFKTAVEQQTVVPLFTILNEGRHANTGTREKSGQLNCWLTAEEMQSGWKEGRHKHLPAHWYGVTLINLADVGLYLREMCRHLIHSLYKLFDGCLKHALPLLLICQAYRY